MAQTVSGRIFLWPLEGEAAEWGFRAVGRRPSGWGNAEGELRAE